MSESAALEVTLAFSASSFFHLEASALLVESRPQFLFQPDIVMFQNADGNFTGQFETKAILSANGQVNWEVPMIFRSSCKIDVTYFPYDTQNCSLTFGSRTYDKEGIGL
jgi:hypothetical protein